MDTIVLAGNKLVKIRVENHFIGLLRTIHNNDNINNADIVLKMNLKRTAQHTL